MRTEDEADAVATGEASGEFSVLDLDPINTEFYVGGVPDHGRVRLFYPTTCLMFL